MKTSQVDKEIKIVECKIRHYSDCNVYVGHIIGQDACNNFKRLEQGIL